MPDLDTARQIQKRSKIVKIRRGTRQWGFKVGDIVTPISVTASLIPGWSRVVLSEDPERVIVAQLEPAPYPAPWSGK